MTQETADAKGLKTIADLEGVASEMTLAAPPEFKTRVQGIPGLEKTYGVKFKTFRPLKAGQATVQALKNGQVDAANIFSTDPSIAANDFVVLEDTEKLYGSQNIVPLVRTEVQDKVAPVLDAVSAKLTTEVVADLRSELPGTGFAAERSTGLAAERMFAAIHDHPEDLVCTDRIEALQDARAGKLLARNPHLTDDEFLVCAAEVVAERVVLSYSGAGGLAEMSAPGVTKAAALQAWCDELGIDPAEVWTFGDMPNDLPMLTWSGRSFAVANAHPEVRAAATDTTGSNDDDGVAAILEALLQ